MEGSGAEAAGPGGPPPSRGWRTRGLGIPAALTLRPGGWLRRASSGGAGDAHGAGHGGERQAGSMAGPCHRVDSRDESRMSS